MLELNKIYNFDCLGSSGMCQIDDQSIDLVICDTPYSITGNRNSWDRILPVDKLWEQYKRIIKPTGVIVLTATNPYASLLVVSNLEMYRYEWIWHKIDSTSNFASVKHQPFRKHEQCLVFSYGKITHTPNGGYITYYPQMEEGKPYKAKRGKQKSTLMANGENYKLSDGEYGAVRYPGTVITISTERGLHPNQKPVGLFEYFIKTYTQENDIVLDNTIGSGTTAEAAINLNRNFIGFEWKEKNPREYYEIAIQRAKDTVIKQNKHEQYKNIFECN